MASLLAASSYGYAVEDGTARAIPLPEGARLRGLVLLLPFEQSMRVLAQVVSERLLVTGVVAIEANAFDGAFLLLAARARIAVLPCAPDAEMLQRIERDVTGPNTSTSGLVAATRLFCAAHDATPRQTAVVQMLVDRLTHTEIAEELGLTRDTVVEYANDFRRKAGCANVEDVRRHIREAPGRKRSVSAVSEAADLRSLAPPATRRRASGR
jgi:DNA-binding NarL/FixJ family response regulator